VVRLERLGIRVVPLTDAAYPPALATLVDAPLVLLVRGNPQALAARCALAVVGARAATDAARATARRLGRELAGRGVVVVSGLARGIDAEAHRGAIEAKGSTIGVLACGPDQIYPPEHRDLAKEMEIDGAIVSEMPVGTPPRAFHFPLRNRIISGLCLGVIVVEARRRSGSLITVRHALNQGRDVFVVPGSIDGPFAEGTNQLLRDGARVIRSARDVLEDLGYEGDCAVLEEAPADGSPSPTARGRSLAARLLAELERGPVTRDQLLMRIEHDAGAMAEALLELELDGRIVQDRDGRIHLSWS
jgi:DNA processing protein